MPIESIMTSLSICIATHERANLLQRALESVALQDRLPDEIVISDSSSTDTSWQVVKTFMEAYPNLSIKYCKSSRKALPWQRWLAFSNSSGEYIFFMDDDIRLDPEVCTRIMQTFLSIPEHSMPPAGVGLIITLEGGIPYLRSAHSWREKWLGTSDFQSGTITSGGLTITHAGLPLNSNCQVQWLWGACMVYRRSVLESVGLLQGLVDLYDLGIGKGEDAVLSVQANHYGQLLLLTDRLAYHPPLENALQTANAHSGWLLGLRETIGRCHTMRWMSTNAIDLKKDWLRNTTRELVMSMNNLLFKPIYFDSWARLAGCLFGIFWCINHWNAIPDSPKNKINLSGIPI